MPMAYKCLTSLQQKITGTHLNLFREVDLAKNSTDEHTIRIACQSITYWTESTATIDEKLKSPIHSLDTLVASPYELIAPSLLLIGYDQASIESVLKRNPTATIQTMETLLREKRSTTVDNLVGGCDGSLSLGSLR
jgi:hypothetical protein